MRVSAEIAVELPTLAATGNSPDDTGAFTVKLLWWDQASTPNPIVLKWDSGLVNAFEYGQIRSGRLEQNATYQGPLFRFVEIRPRTTESRIESGPLIRRSASPSTSTKSDGSPDTVVLPLIGGRGGKEARSRSPVTTTPSRRTSFPSFKALRISVAFTAWASRSCLLQSSLNSLEKRPTV